MKHDLTDEEIKQAADDGVAAYKKQIAENISHAIQSGLSKRSFHEGKIEEIDSLIERARGGGPSTEGAIISLQRLMHT